MFNFGPLFGSKQGATSGFLAQKLAERGRFHGEIDFSDTLLGDLSS